MEEPFEIDDAAQEPTRPPGRLARAIRVLIIVMLIVSMVWLAFISGAGIITVKPEVRPVPTVRTV